MVFADRQDAGRRLAHALSAYKGQRPLILAIPRGAVPMGRTIADLLARMTAFFAENNNPAPVLTSQRQISPLRFHIADNMPHKNLTS